MWIRLMLVDSPTILISGSGGSLKGNSPRISVFNVGRK